MPNLKQVKERAAAREQASKVIGSLACEIASELSEDARLAFWEELRNYAQKRLPDAPAPVKHPEVVPMTDSEARVFGQQEMPFGKHRGKLICQVPLLWFDWLIGEDQGALSGKLVRYLNNEKVAKQLALELED